MEQNNNYNFRIYSSKNAVRPYPHTFKKQYDVVYFDAFAPEKQPELWEEVIFSKIAATMPSGGILSTYCAKGEVRRRLQRAGFIVERLPGPLNGKREILRGRIA